MEALQLAQMLADLNDLQAAQDQGAAKSLVAANKNLDRDKKTDQTSAPSFSQSKPDTPAVDGRIASPAGRFDKLGRRIFSPPLSRNNSFTPSSSVPGTPRREEPDGDIDRASTLLSLYEIRAKLKEQDNQSLTKAREKINALAARQAKLAREQKTSAPQQNAQQNKDATASSRISYPK